METVSIKKLTRELPGFLREEGNPVVLHVPNYTSLRDLQEKFSKKTGIPEGKFLFYELFSEFPVYFPLDKTNQMADWSKKDLGYTSV